MDARCVLTANPGNPGSSACISTEAWSKRIWKAFQDAIIVLRRLDLGSPKRPQRRRETINTSPKMRSLFIRNDIHVELSFTYNTKPRDYCATRENVLSAVAYCILKRKKYPDSADQTSGSSTVSLHPCAVCMLFDTSMPLPTFSKRQ